MFNFLMLHCNLGTTCAGVEKEVDVPKALLVNYQYIFICPNNSQALIKLLRFFLSFVK